MKFFLKKVSEALALLKFLPVDNRAWGGLDLWFVLDLASTTGSLGN